MNKFKLLISSVALSAVFLAGTVAAEVGDAANGEEQFKKHCSACHNVLKGATPDVYGVVLPLYGIIGREAAKTKGFFYSKAMRKSGAVWTEEFLNKYIEDPKGTIPGIRMEFVGLKDAKYRSDMVAYIKSVVDED